jgi:hypothetical protein
MKTTVKILGATVLLGIALSFSCKKSDDLDDNNYGDPINTDTLTPPTITYDSIQAGIYDTSFIYHEFQNPIVFNVIWEQSKLAGNASASAPISIAGDSVIMNFRLRIINPDSSFIISQMDTFLLFYFKVYPHDSLSIYTVKKTYYVGLGSTTDFYFASALNSQDWISTRLLWWNNYSNNTLRWISLWEMPTNVGTIQGFNGGPWFVTGITYMGFRYKKHLGWMKIDNSNRSAPKILSYAIKK